MTLLYQHAREMIAYQTDGFKDKLIAAVKDLLSNGSARDAQNSTARRLIETMILERTGVNIYLWVNEESPELGEPCIMPVFLNNCHVLRNDPKTGTFSPGIIEALSRSKGFFKGTVDYRKGKLGGDYSKIEMPVRFGFGLMSKEIKDAEKIAGILMHEVGHGWTILAMSWMTARTNFFMASVRDTILNGGPMNDVTYFVKELSAVMHDEGLLISENSLDPLLNMKDQIAINTFIYTQVFKRAEVNFGTFVSTSHNTESLADAYATRFGFGPAIASLVQDDYLKKNAPANQAIGTAAIGTMCSDSLGVGVAFGLVLSSACAVFSGNDTDGVRGAEDRIRQIRTSLIDAIKPDTLKPAVRADLLAQIAALKTMQNSVKNEKEGIFRSLMNLLVPSKRADKEAMELDRQLETLSSSNLYVSGNALRGVASKQ